MHIPHDILIRTHKKKTERIRIIPGDGWKVQGKRLALLVLPDEAIDLPVRVASNIYKAGFTFRGQV